MKESFSAVKFICAIPRLNSDNGNLQIVHEKCVFKTGLGPCGKNVIKLEVETNDGLMTITQTTGTSQRWISASVVAITDREVKRFTYKLSDVLGRIEATSA